MSKPIDDFRLTQAVLNFFIGKDEILYSEKENAWIDSKDETLIRNDDAYDMALKFLEDALIDIEAIQQPLEATPIFRLSCGCCPVCGCTCTESELNEVRRRLS